MNYYITFADLKTAQSYIYRATRLGWTCSTPWLLPTGKYSVCTNRP